MVLVLGEPPGVDAPPKLAVLSRLRAAGVPVPPGLGLIPGELSDPATRAALTGLLREGPVIVRAALAGEDTREASAAGLGLSIPDCCDLAAVDAAAAQIVRAAHDPWLLHYSGGAAPSVHLLVQRQIPRRWLAVVAADRFGAGVELHDTTHPDALATGATPAFSGPVALSDPALRAPLTRLIDHVGSILLDSSAHPAARDTPASSTEHDRPPMPGAPSLHALTRAPTTGLDPSPPLAPHRPPTTDRGSAQALDLEIVIDTAGVPWLVQARPLTRPLSPGWPAFLAEAAPGHAQIPDLPGLWRLDAEHNPAPLSPAHTGVIAWLAGRGARLRVLAGWLYEPVSSDTPSAPGLPPRDALAALHADIAGARRSLTDLEHALDALASANPPARGVALARLLERALEHLRTTLARCAALRASPPPAARERLLRADLAAAPLCLRDRGAHLDVLPAAWDIASPALADMLHSPCLEGPASPALPDDPSAAWVLLREEDDHLFALGLAPLRRVYLVAGERLGLGADVFLLTPHELSLALTTSTCPDLDGRRAALARQAALVPPLALHDGRPVPVSPRRHLHGLPAGATFRGPLAQRRDLGDLLARPPDPRAIVVLPALTAQAAVALQALALRAVCCEHGGALSHAALMVRELGLSALIGCLGCTELPDGALAEIDARVGRLRLLADEP